MRRHLLTVVSLLSLAATALVAAGSGASNAAALAGGASGATSRGFLPAPLPPASPSTVPSPEFAPRSGLAVKVEGSFNWAGYAQSVKTGVFTSVQDTWRVPVVSTALPGSQYSSDWVGIGGFTHDSTLVQAGTEADNINGTAVYDAWTEILPQSEDVFPTPVHPNDLITSLVQETAPDTWLVEVVDHTTGVTQSRVLAYASSGDSVEAIHERTSLCSSTCALANFAMTSDVIFDPGTYTSTLQPTAQPLLVPAIQREKVTRKTTKIKPAKLFEIVMVSTTKPRSAVATPSAPDSDQDGFTVADGAVAPPPPSS